VLAIGLGAAWYSRQHTENSCANAADADLALGNLGTARSALEHCLRGRSPSSLEAAAMKYLETCEAQSMRLKEAELDLERNDVDRLQRALDFAPTPCVAPAHSALTLKLERLREAKRSQAAARILADVPEDAPLPGGLPPVAPAPARGSPKDLLNKARTVGLNQPGSALLWLERCVEVDPLNAECFKQLGGVYGRLGRGGAGAEAYEKFLKLAPDDPYAEPVRKLLARYYAATK
jgi:tetratricopeptide (TPR) repeat protein